MFIEKRGKKRAGLLLLSLLLTFSLAFSSVVYAEPLGNVRAEEWLTAHEIAFLEAIDYDEVYDHLTHISDEIGIGVAGGPAERRRAEYLASVLETLGYAPWSHAADTGYFQTIKDDTSVIAIIGGSLTINGREYPANGPNWSDSSVYRGYEISEIEGEIVYFETAAEAIEADSAEIKEKIVLTNRNSDGSFADDVRKLEAKGALAVVYFYNKYTIADPGRVSNESRFSAPTTGDDINIPVILTSYFDGQAILAELDYHGEAERVEATVRNSRNTTTQNVLAIKEAAVSSDQYVLIGAHYDSVFGAVGANDNLSGVTSVLGIAAALKDIPTTYNVIFAFWGAEEIGLRGSRYFYANTLAPNDYYKDFIAYFNLDMTATSQLSNSYLTVHTPFRDANNNPRKSSAGELFEIQAARYWAYANGKWGDLWTKDGAVGIAYYGNCSDHASISGANAGNTFEDAIPQVYVFWEGPGVVEYNNHRVGDRYDWPGDAFQLTGEEDDFAGNYSIEKAEILTSIFALSLYEAAGAYELEAWDLNADGLVDEKDLKIAQKFYWVVKTDADWTVVQTNGNAPSQADINDDGVVNLYDLLEIYLNYSK